MDPDQLNDPDDLLPEERALLEGKDISAGAAGDDDATGADAAAAEEAGELDAAALAAVAAEGAAVAASAAAAATKPEAGAGADDAAASAAAAAEPPPAPPPSRFDAGDPATFDAQRQALLTKKAEALAGMMDGKIDPAAFALVDGEVTTGLEQLTVQRTLHEANLQQERERQVSTLSALRADGTKNGIDYADPAIGAMFDAKARQLGALPENAGKSVSELYTATHAEVLKMFGKGAAAPAPTPAAPAGAPAAAATPAAPAPRPVIPPSLGSMPAAAAVQTGQDMADVLAGIDDPDQAEAAMAKMTPQARENLLRSTMPATAARRARH